MWVRLVKGAYWDYETIMAAQQGWPVPVCQHKWQTDANLRAADALSAGESRAGCGRPSAATTSAAWPTPWPRPRSWTLPPRSFEMQMLYGMAEPIKDALVGMGRRVRVYTPYGQLLPGMAYLVRRLLENTANESFLRASFTEHVPEEQLLMNPLRIRGTSCGRADARTARRKYVRLRPMPAFHNEPLTDFSREANRAGHAVGPGRGRQATWTRPIRWSSTAKTLPTAQTIDSLNPSHKQADRRPLRQSHAGAGASRPIAAATAAFPAGATPTRPSGPSTCSRPRR